MTTISIPNRADATSFEIAEMWALREPRRLAVAEGTRRYGYADVVAHAIRFTRHFQQAGIQRGEVVAVSQLGLFGEIVAALACENLGAVSASFLSQGDPEEEAVFRMADWVVSERPRTLPEGTRSIWLDAPGVAAIEAIDPADGTPYPRIALELSEPQRLTRTSGSTGRAKWMVLTRRMMEAWIRASMGAEGSTAESLTFVGPPFIVNASLTKSMAALRMSAALARVRGSELGDLALTEFGGLPLHLEHFLAELPQTYQPKGPVLVFTGGGFLPRALGEQAERRLRGQLRNIYGINEVGYICMELDDGGTGVIEPGIDVRIVAEDGRDLAPGEVGIIAVRSVMTVQGYVGDPQSSAESFRDGWFLSGDYGRLVAPRRLQLLGRRDDLINVGGLKMPAFQLEELARKALGGADVAIHSMPGTAPLLGVAVVAGAADRDALLARLRDGLVSGVTLQMSVLFVDALPRTPNGKVDRAAVARLFART